MFPYPHVDCIKDYFGIHFRLSYPPQSACIFHMDKRGKYFQGIRNHRNCHLCSMVAFPICHLKSSILYQSSCLRSPRKITRHWNLSSYIRGSILVLSALAAQTQSLCVTLFQLKRLESRITVPTKNKFPHPSTRTQWKMSNDAIA